ncbi:UNVERIFIED_CONTAM: hypothetical protein K2H54_074413 [Gekko kuhli]
MEVSLHLLAPDPWKPIAMQVLGDHLQQLPDVCWSAFMVILFHTAFTLAFFGAFHSSKLCSASHHNHSRQALALHDVIIQGNHAEAAATSHIPTLRALGADMPSATALPLSIFGQASPASVSSGSSEASVFVLGAWVGHAAAAKLLFLVSPAVIRLLPSHGIPIRRCLPLRYRPVTYKLKYHF